MKLYLDSLCDRDLLSIVLDGCAEHKNVFNNTHGCLYLENSLNITDYLVAP